MTFKDFVCVLRTFEDSILNRSAHTNLVLGLVQVMVVKWVILNYTYVRSAGNQFSLFDSLSNLYSYFCQKNPPQKSTAQHKIFL